MGTRLVRFGEVREQVGVFPDSRLAGLARSNRFVVGAGNGPAAAVVADPSMSIEFVSAGPRIGVGEHRHTYCEAFVVLSGQWRFSWHDDGADMVSVIADVHDVVWVPAGVWRSALNVSDSDAMLLVVAGAGDDCEFPGWLVDNIASAV